jgi:AAA15 family ATPase/GTPase
MIHYFKGSNFHSINDEVLLDFRTTASGARGDGYVQSKIDEDVFLKKVVAIFGPNESGKTNVLRILPYIAWLISSSFQPSSKRNLALVPFLFGERKDLSAFEVVFELQNELFKYCVEISGAKEIVKEELFLMNPDTKHYRLLYKRLKIQDKDEYEIQDKGLSVNIPTDSANIPTASFIAVAAQFGHKKCRQISDYWELISKTTNIRATGRVDFSNDRARLSAYTEILKEHPETKKKLLSIFENLDIQIADIESKDVTRFTSPTDKDLESIQERDVTKEYHPFFIHSVSGENKKFSLPFHLESSGVQNLFALLIPAIPLLDNTLSAPLVLDEIDAGIHPNLIPEFIGIFRSFVRNPYNHQLLITLHSNQVMEVLEKNQIYLTDNGNRKGTRLYSLDSIKGVRKDISFSAAYRAGRFGGLPKID